MSLGSVDDLLDGVLRFAFRDFSLAFRLLNRTLGSLVRKTQLARQAGSLADQAAFSAFWLTTFVAIEVSAMSVACSSSSVV